MSIAEVHSYRAQAARGTLVVIGGREDRSEELLILREVASRLHGGRLAIVTVASTQGDELYAEYQGAFGKLGVEVVQLPIDRREDALDPAKCKVLEGAGGVFFTGGDQIRITSELGGTPACDMIYDLHQRGGVIAGTSAGASVLGQVMPVSGAQDDSARVRDQLRLVPGLGFVRDVIIDQHFAQRGRLGRIIGAVAQNPLILGIGIDEDTALVFDEYNAFTVVGSGAATVADGRGVTYTNINEADSDHIMSVFDLRLHVLSAGDVFDMRARRPALSRQQVSEPDEPQKSAASGREGPSNGARAS
nr:Cyanophycinase [uncultured bacterium]